MWKGNSNNFTENSSRLIAIQKRETWNQNVKQKSPVKKAYMNFGRLVSTVKLLKLKDWNVKYKTSYILIKNIDPVYVLPRYQLYINCDLYFTIRVFGWKLSDAHNIYTLCFRNVKNITM